LGYEISIFGSFILNKQGLPQEKRIYIVPNIILYSVRQHNYFII